MFIEAIIWLVMGFLCYKLAEKKNRNKNLAFVMGILLSLFALIYYLVVKKVEKVEEEKSLDRVS